MQNYYGMSGMGWYDFARSCGFTGTPEQLMKIMTGNIVSMLDHQTLDNRDAADQHPITAISGLAEELNRLQDVQGDGAAVSDGWRVMELYPIKWSQSLYTEIEATSDHWEYFPMPDEVNISEGVWEVELYVLGLGGSTADTALHVALIDRQVGVENAWQKSQPFAVSPTQEGSPMTFKNQVRYRAIVQGCRYFCERDGYVLGTMTHDQIYSGINWENEADIYANTVAVHVYNRGASIGTGGIYLRYRRMM
jgi:hypothetical protein